MNQVLLSTAIGVPIIAGLTQVFQKAFSVSANKTPLMSLVIGLLLGVIAYFALPGTGLLTIFVGAVVSSLGANGLYDHANAVIASFSSATPSA